MTHFTLLTHFTPLYPIKFFIELQMRQMHGELILIFVARKNTCDFVANQLNRIGVKAAAMHSDRYGCASVALIVVSTEGRNNNTTMLSA